MEIEIGKLEVSVYTDIICKKHVWNLTFRPVIKCPYYLALDKDDRTIFDNYIALINKRRKHEGHEEHKESYEYLKKMYSSIKEDDRYIPEKFKDQPMEVWGETTERGTRVLKVGHHRAAVLYKLYEPKYCIDVRENNEHLPTDHNLCSNPCKE